MSTLTIQLPESLKKHIDVLAAKEGDAVSHFLASAAGEKMAAVHACSARHLRLPSLTCATDFDRAY